jgi:hypothetical protein
VYGPVPIGRSIGDAGALRGTIAMNTSLLRRTGLGSRVRRTMVASSTTRTSRMDWT